MKKAKSPLQDTKEEVIWRPHAGPQTEALKRTEFEVLYGGARGGGKTDAGIVWLLDYRCIDNPRYRALIIRKNARDTNDWIDRAGRIYGELGATFTQNPAVFTFPSGAKFYVGHLADKNAYEKYQGHEYHRILIEELTQIATEQLYLQLILSCRSTVAGIDAQVFATTNPGGRGHGWVRSRFIDCAHVGSVYTDKNTGLSRVFIPSRVDDNPTIMERDPLYVQRLEMLRESDYELYKAWRLGDWDTFAGQYFREFSVATHVVDPVNPRAELPRFAGMDWGYSSPCALVSVAVQQVEYAGKKFRRLWVHDEMTATQKTPEEWGRDVVTHLPLSRYVSIQVDPSTDSKKESENTILSQLRGAMGEYASKVCPAVNDRKAGWMLVRRWLTRAPDGLPYILIGRNCRELVRTLPLLVHDDLDVEDLDTLGEDHHADALRYAIMRIPFVDPAVGSYGGGDTIDEYMKKYKISKGPADLTELLDVMSSERKRYL